MFDSLKIYLDKFSISIDMQIKYISMLLKLCVYETVSINSFKYKITQLTRTLCLSIVYGIPILGISGFTTALDMDDKIGSLITLIIGINTIVKLLSIELNKEKFFMLLKELKDNYKTHSCNVQEKTFVITSLRYSSYFMNMIRGSFLMAVLVPLMVPHFSSKEWMLPYSLSIPGINHRKHPGYEIVYFMSGGLSFVVIIIIAAMDSMFCIFTYLIVTKFDITMNYLKQIGDDKYKNNELLIKNCIKLHIQTINIIKRVSYLFQATVLVQYMCNGALMPITLFHIKINAYNMSFFLLAAAMIDLFLYCFCGQLVIDKAEELANTIYCCQWYNLEKNSDKKDLIIFLENAQAPVGFSAGGLFELTMNTFTQTLKSGLSLWAFLNYIMEDT